MVLPPHSELVGLLPSMLNCTLPGVEAHRTMAPYPARVKPEMISVEGKDAREAATLVLLYPYHGGKESALVLTVRQPELRDHSGQVSLPGGSRDGSEMAEETASARAGRRSVCLPSILQSSVASRPFTSRPADFPCFPSWPPWTLRPHSRFRKPKWPSYWKCR